MHNNLPLAGAQDYLTMNATILFRKFKRIVCILEDYIEDPEIYKNEIEDLRDDLTFLYNALRNMGADIDEGWLERMRDVGVDGVFSRPHVED